jgi:thiosulfate dehydrogenase [quinone] large subunit
VSSPGRGVKRRRRSDPATAVPPALALLPLRGFLGVTFVYAGIQKLSDPGFLHQGAPTYIGAQLHAFANGTPGGFLLRAFALPHPKLAGVAVALVEIVIGLLALAGLLTRAAATAGLALNLLLFLTNSWKTSPYFLGPDIVFVFAWLPFVLTGASGQPAIDNSLDRLVAARHRRLERAGGRRGGVGRSLPVAEDPAVTRRAFMARALGATGMLALTLGGISALAKGAYRASGRRLGAGSATSAASVTSTSASPASQPSAGPSPSVPPGGARLGASSQLAPGQGALYTDPGDQQPDIVIRQSDRSPTAFSGAIYALPS